MISNGKDTKMNRRNSMRNIQHLLNALLWLTLCVAAIYHKTSVYLIHQAAGQLAIISKTVTIEEYRTKKVLTKQELEALETIERVKKYSVDTLGFKVTNNYLTLYDDATGPVLWVVTACEPYVFKPYTWKFPLVGEVSYKGFFRKDLATIEYNHLVCLGYDVDLRPVSAWSTLGWLKDPILTSTLRRSKGALCNLFFHELFHSTYYAPGSVDLNENLANFVAHKATCRFLANDTNALGQYLRSYRDKNTFTAFMNRSMHRLEKQYLKIKDTDGKYLIKMKEIFLVADSIAKLPLCYKKPYVARTADMLKFKNAYFVDFIQYDSKQDSLDVVFNKIYGGKIENLVRYLKQN